MDNSKTSQCLLVFTILTPWLGSLNLIDNKSDEAAYGWF